MNKDVHNRTVYNSRKNGNNLNVHKQADRLKKSWYIYKVEYYIGNQTHKKIYIDIERYPPKKM